MGNGLIPPTGARAAHVLLDAVVSQSATQSPEANVNAMQLALASLAEPEAGDPRGSDPRPGPGDVVGASVVCITWLATRESLPDPCTRQWLDRLALQGAILDLRPEDLAVPGAVSGTSGEPLYRIRLRLQRQSVQAYGETLPLKSGMLVDASVLLEQRRLYEWVLEPLFSISGRL